MKPFFNKKNYNTVIKTTHHKRKGISYAKLLGMAPEKWATEIQFGNFSGFERQLTFQVSAYW